MSRGYVRDRGSCLNRPDREEENLYKKLPRILSGDAAQGDAWLMGSSVLTAILVRRTECTTLRSSQKDREELVEEVRASMIGTLGRMLDAKLAGIEERLLPAKTLRPPLAADRRKEAADSRKEAAQKPKKKKKSSAPKEKAPASNDESDGGEWVTVVRKTKKKSGRSPSWPVLVTLRPEAASKGVTYCQVLQSAAEKVNLADVGIEGGLKMRIAATGARLLELPKGQAPEVVDLFTRELRTALDDVARVVQPTKYASIRITGLDDSVTPQMVVEAVAKAGQTVADNVKAGDVRSDRGDAISSNGWCRSSFRTARATFHP
ncbi:unnamed protein product [Euphydryas editha]|uniref:Gag-like protein n=1 Tax=Euphydryas editha TaxID=104508 RepID=A0AAU9UQ97_EUPED|nr:unnamed protein product [Euphydryas editha]